MLEWLLGSKRCKVHDRELLSGTATTSYGRVLIPADYKEAAKQVFPHARSFVVMGRPGVCRRAETNVLYCPECRKAEAEWHRHNPDWNRPSSVFLSVQTERRCLPNSAAKRLLHSSQLREPEQAARYVWIVYRLSSEALIAYDSENHKYLYPYTTSDSPGYANVEALAEALGKKLKDQRTCE